MRKTRCYWRGLPPFTQGLSNEALLLARSFRSARFHMCDPSSRPAIQWPQAHLVQTSLGRLQPYRLLWTFQTALSPNLLFLLNGCIVILLALAAGLAYYLFPFIVPVAERPRLLLAVLLHVSPRRAKVANLTWVLTLH